MRNTWPFQAHGIRRDRWYGPGFLTSWDELTLVAIAGVVVVVREIIVVFLNN
jgi:hypothetical protein